MKVEIMNSDRTSIDQLAAQAREAYEEKRTRECIALINAILSVDPEHVEANTLQSEIQLQINRDMHDARALLEDSRTTEDGQRYRKAAEIILLKALNLAPANEEARALLSLTRGASDSPVIPAAAPAVAREEALRDPEPLAELGFTIGTSSKTDGKPKEQRSFRLPLISAAIVVLAGALAVVGYSYLKSRGTGGAAEVPSPIESRTESSARALPVEETPRAAIPARQQPLPQQPIVTSSTKISSNSVVPVAPLTVAPDAGAAANSIKPAAAVGDGTLAVSSLIPADIYRNNKYLGSTPTTLQLPAGRQTLEYRHEDLRVIVTHNIKSKETSTALITFETVVQINARPWAQVFIGGATRRPLGQTPLSNVRVPIGGVLVFENPNFPSKNYRVNDKETAIQVVFP